MPAIKTNTELRETLLDCINKVIDGKMEPRDAMAVSHLSANVLRSVILDLKVQKLLNKDSNKAHLDDSGGIHLVRLTAENGANGKV